MKIAIDGPSGAGKSTLGRMLAREFGYLYIDTGAMYRAAALAVIEARVDVTDPSVPAIVKSVDIALAGDPDSLQVLLNGRDVSTAIRTEQVSHTASMISIIPEVRRVLVDQQRLLGNHGTGAVLDGRDIGSVVFPNAEVKFFLTASPEARAARRFEEERGARLSVTLAEIYEDIVRRDERDSTRADSPLAIAADAIVVDSTALTVDEVFEKLVAEVRQRV